MTQPIAMPWAAPVFGAPPHRWQGVRIAGMPFTPRPAAVERILPPGMEPADGPGMVTLISYPQSEFHPYNELVVLVPVSVDGVSGNYVPYIYVTTDEALIAGREVAGFPKKIAQIEWHREGDRFAGSATRWGTSLLTIEGEVHGPVPRGADRSAPAGAPTFNYKLIPGPAGEIEVEEITQVRLEVVPRGQEAGQASVRCGRSDDDPIADLVPDFDGPLVIMTCDVTIPPGEVVKRIARRELVA